MLFVGACESTSEKIAVKDQLSENSQCPEKAEGFKPSAFVL